jgi:hypothetical protein
MSVMDFLWGVALLLTKTSWFIRQDHWFSLMARMDWKSIHNEPSVPILSFTTSVSFLKLVQNSSFTHETEVCSAASQLQKLRLFICFNWETCCLRAFPRQAETRSGDVASCAIFALGAAHTTLSVSYRCLSSHSSFTEATYTHPLALTADDRIDWTQSSTVTSCIVV